MSGPVSTADCPPDAEQDAAAPPAAIEVWDARESQVGARTVRRAMPRRERRTVGPWCFADHFGPEAHVDDDTALAIGPHPHIGLHTVTWLYEGEVRHTDSLGSDQVIRPGQLNLMTAGHGIAHAEVTTSDGLRVGSHGLQLWVAQPEGTRHGPPAFEHHPELPRVDFGGGRGTVVIGELDRARSPARADSPMLGLDLVLDAPAEVPLDPDHEHAVIALTSGLEVEGTTVAPDQTAYLGAGRASVELAPAESGAQAFLLGGRPFGEKVLMWWNYVARSREEVDAARADWEAIDEDRFGPVSSAMGRLSAPPTPWT
jgi:quercetin 2,3-dioxygenase